MCHAPDACAARWAETARLRNRACRIAHALSARRTQAWERARQCGRWWYRWWWLALLLRTAARGRRGDGASRTPGRRAAREGRARSGQRRARGDRGARHAARTDARGHPRFSATRAPSCAGLSLVLSCARGGAACRLSRFDRSSLDTPVHSCRPLNVIAGTSHHGLTPNKTPLASAAPFHSP